MGVAAGDSDRVLRLSAGWDTDWADWEEVVRRLERIWTRLSASA
jgi:hypothetical protein